MSAIVIIIGIRLSMLFFGRLSLTFILVGTLALNSNCQDMAGLFRLLPIAYTPELKNKGKEILIRKGEYTIPGGDSTDMEKYSIDTDRTKNYLRCEDGYTTGQRGFSIIEIKKFKKLNGEFILVFSKYGGVPVEFDQQEFKVFDIKKGKLIESKENLIPNDIGLKNLLRTGYSDSLFTLIKNNTNSSFLLNSETENEIEFRISSPLDIDDYKNYMIGNVILFTWNGQSFVKRKIWD